MDLFLTLRLLLVLHFISASAWACPSGCKCSGDYISCIGLSTFPTPLPPSSQGLVLINCSVSVLTPEDLTGVPDLNAFGIRSGDLSEVQPDALQPVAHLRKFLFQDVKVQDLPDNLFGKNQELQSLHLKKTLLRVFRPNWFSGLKSLLRLDLSGNLFTSLPSEAFQPLMKLQSLTLSSNNVSQLANDTFNGLSQLLVLRLNRNSLQDLPAGCFDDLENLEELSLHDNSIAHLPKDLFSKTLKLKKLYVSNNKLRSLSHGIFLNLPLLSQISLYENHLETLGPGVFGPMPLQELWLYDNKLSTLEEDTFRNLTHLRLLVLSRNRIHHVSGRAFTGLVQVGEVSLHTNLLTTLQAGTFQGMPNLVNISLEHNLISSLPTGLLQGVTTLGQIDLRNNSLHNLPQQSLDELEVASEILLQQNPWRCDRDILPLLNWVKRNPTKVNQTLVVCETPFELRGEEIALLTAENLVPTGSTAEPPLTSTEKMRKPTSPPAEQSASSPAATDNSKAELDNGMGSGAAWNSTWVTIIAIAVVATVVISTVIFSCLCWKRKKRGRGEIGRRNKNSVL